MKLNIKNRLILLQILPNKGNLSDMVEVMDLAKQLKLSDKEKELINYKIDDSDNIYWDSNKDFEKDFELNSDKIKILKETINKLDSEKEIPLVLVDLALEIKNLK
jgi:hypothetical protein